MQLFICCQAEALTGIHNMGSPVSGSIRGSEVVITSSHSNSIMISSGAVYFSFISIYLCSVYLVGELLCALDRSDIVVLEINALFDDYVTVDVGDPECERTRLDCFLEIEVIVFLTGNFDILAVL